MKSDRRLIGLIAASFLAGMAVSAYPQAKAPVPGVPVKKIDFGEEYYQESVRILNLMWNNHKDQIGKISEHAAAVLRAGNKVVWDCTAGHSNILEVDPNLPCLPKGGMISAMEFSGQKATIDGLGKSDMLITNYINEQTVAAHERGVYVVGVTDSYFRHRSYSEQDNLDKKPNYKDLELEGISDEVLISEAPGQVGLVAMPHIPEMKCGAGTGNFMIALYWYVVSEVADKMKNPDSPSLKYATQYRETLMKRLESIHTSQKALIWKTAATVAEKIGHGGRMWVDSTPGSVNCDASGASMGMTLTNFFDRKTMKAGDVYLVAEVSDSTNTKMTQYAAEAKAKGAYVIGIGPSNQSAIKKVADAYFDNLSPEGYGLFQIKGHDNRIALAGSLINCIVYGAFSSQLADEMCKRGWDPKYYMSYNWGGASGGYFEWLRWSVNRAGF
jgi:uncharacterized phosphosugar-binding protein